MRKRHHHSHEQRNSHLLRLHQQLLLHPDRLQHSNPRAANRLHRERHIRKRNVFPLHKGKAHSQNDFRLGFQRTLSDNSPNSALRVRAIWSFWWRRCSNCHRVMCRCFCRLSGSCSADQVVGSGMLCTCHDANEDDVTDHLISIFI